MDRKPMNPPFDRLAAAVGKYKYAIAVVLLGVLLMLLPSGRRTQTVTVAAEPEGRAAVEREMEEVLSAFDGVGRLRLMLTVTPGTERWAGAVVVCEGGGSAAVRLQLTQAVSALTGLPSDKITIVRGKP